MKTVSPAMAAHLAQGSTTLTTLWEIERVDGKKLFYTELDKDLTYKDNLYQSASGFNKSAIKSTATLAAGGLDVTGFLRDDGISDEEIRNGAFDFAKVRIFMVNYEDLSMGEIKLRTGHFGEVQTTDSGAFLVELRGLVDMLNYRIGDTYLNECRLDLGSPKCGIKLIPNEHQAGMTYKAGDRVVVPISDPSTKPVRAYPDLVDPNKVDWNRYTVTPDPLMGPNINMQPIKGPKVLQSTPYFTPAPRYYDVPLASIGVTPLDLASGGTKVTFRAKYYGYWDGSAGYIRIESRRVNGTVITLGTAREECPIGQPGRRWREVSVTVNLLPDTSFLRLEAGVVNNPSGKSVVMCYDDLDLKVIPPETSSGGFQEYGGLEFTALNDGMTSLDEVVFDTTIGSVTVDGTMEWETVQPKYTFLRTVTVDSVSSSRINVGSIDVPDDWFTWGVVKFLTGGNVGRAMEIVAYNKLTGDMQLALPVPYMTVAGDVVQVTTGCAKTASVCFAKFNNMLEFRGHPNVPGQGQYFKVAGLQ